MTERMVENKEKKFEQSLEELENLVRELENGKLPLEEGLTKFEQGVELYKSCKAVLEKTEKRIAVLSKDLKEKVQDKGEVID